MYKCSKCPQRFPVTSQVLDHWKVHHREAMKNVQPLCRFTKNVASPEVTWWCPFCNDKFTNENSRDSHIENVHEQGMPQIDFEVNCCQIFCLKNVYPYNFDIYTSFFIFLL